MTATPEYVCREPRSPEELLDIFRLRHRVFIKSGLGFLLNSTAVEYEADIDCYDLRSAHFGLYECLENDCRLIGCIRAVGRAETPAAAWIRAFAGDKPRLSRELDCTLAHALPLFQYSPFPEVLAAIEIKCTKEGKTLFEIGRFAMEASRRAYSITRSLVEMVIAFTMCCNGSMIFSCRPEHRRFYQPYLIWPLALTPEFEYGGIRMTTIFWDKALLPALMRKKMEQAAKEYWETGELRLFQVRNEHPEQTLTKL